MWKVIVKPLFDNKGNFEASETKKYLLGILVYTKRRYVVRRPDGQDTKDYDLIYS